MGLQHFRDPERRPTWRLVRSGPDARPATAVVAPHTLSSIQFAVCIIPLLFEPRLCFSVSTDITQVAELLLLEKILFIVPRWFLNNWCSNSRWYCNNLVHWGRSFNNTWRAEPQINLNVLKRLSAQYDWSLNGTHWHRLTVQARSLTTKFCKPYL